MLETNRSPDGIVETRQERCNHSTMREERIKSFENNVSSVKRYFLSKASQSETTEYLQQYFGIRATPDFEVVACPTSMEIFWEDRNFDIDQDGKGVKEKGAKISIRCSVRGFVTIQLFPCYTDSLKCKEDGITLFHKLNPWWLGCNVFQSYLWHVFTAYSTVTAKDGNPSLFSRCVVNLIRYFCTKNVGGIIEGTRLWHDLKIILSIIFAVVSSSLFVYFLPSHNEEKLILIDKKITKQGEVVDSLTKDLKRESIISSKLDSIVYYQKLIEKNTKHKGGKK